MENIHRWMRREIDDWEREGLLSRNLADQLRARYPAKAGRAPRVLGVGLAVLGALLVGGGIILLLAHNWADLSRELRTAIALAPLLAAQLLALIGIVRRRVGAGWREGVATLWLLSIAAAIAIVGQIYHISGSYDSFMLTWVLLSLPVLYLLRSRIAAAIYLFSVVGWAAPLAGEMPRVLTFWPLSLACLPLVARVRSSEELPFGTRLLQWVFVTVLTIGLGITLESALPGMWMLLYASLFSVFFLLDCYFCTDDQSLLLRPLRVFGRVGSLVLALILTYHWPWEEIGWHYWRGELPLWVQLLSCAVAFVLAGGAVALMAVVRRRMRVLDFFSGGFFLVALLGYVLAAQMGEPAVSLLLFNLYVFCFAIALLVSGARGQSLGVVNAGMLVTSLLVVLRFFDAEMSLLVRGLTFIGLGAAFLAVNVVFSRKFRRVP